MMYNTKEWLSIPKEEKLMMIRMTVAENIARLRGACLPGSFLFDVAYENIAGHKP